MELPRQSCKRVLRSTGKKRSHDVVCHCASLGFGACFGVELHSLNMSLVMSRVSNGVGCGSRWQLTGSWRVSLERRSSRRGGVGAIILVTAEVCVSFPQSQRARLA